MPGKGHSLAMANKARRFSTELVELMARYEDPSGEREDGAAADRNSEQAARKLFTKSGASLYLCLNNEDRMQHLDELMHDMKTYAEYEAVTDVAGAFWLTVSRVDACAISFDGLRDSYPSLTTVAFHQRTQGMLAGWWSFFGLWDLPVVNLVCFLGFLLHLLFFASQRFSAAWLLLLLDCLVIHGYVPFRCTLRRSRLRGAMWRRRFVHFLSSGLVCSALLCPVLPCFGRSAATSVCSCRCQPAWMLSAMVCSALNAPPRLASRSYTLNLQRQATSLSMPPGGSLGLVFTMKRSSRMRTRSESSSRVRSR